MLATKHINKVTLSNFVYHSKEYINFKFGVDQLQIGASNLEWWWLQAPLFTSTEILLICLVIFVVVVVVVCFPCFIVVFCSFLFNCCKDLFLDIFYILTIISFKSEAIYKYTLERIGYCAVTKSYMLYIVNTFPICCSPLQRSVRRSFVSV